MITKSILRAQIEILNNCSNREFYLGRTGYGYYIIDRTGFDRFIESGMTAKECHVLLKGLQCAFSVTLYGHV